MNNKTCGCSKCAACRGMGKTQKNMSMKPACNTCKENNWSNSDINEDYSRFKDIVKKNKQMAGSGGGCQNSCTPCQNNCQRCQNSCADCTKNVVSNAYGRRKCDDTNCPLRSNFRKTSSNECPLYFGTDVDELPIAMGYVPYQEWNCNVSNACQGLCDGTIFPELVKPFVCTFCYEERRGC